MITDTTTKAEKLQNEIFMRLSGAQKVRLAMAFSDTVRDIAWAGFRRRHPSVSEEALRTLFLDLVDRFIKNLSNKLTCGLVVSFHNGKETYHGTNQPTPEDSAHG
jgi:hypothetical protein